MVEYKVYNEISTLTWIALRRPIAQQLNYHQDTDNVWEDAHVRMHWNVQARMENQQRAVIRAIRKNSPAR